MTPRYFGVGNVLMCDFGDGRAAQLVTKPVDIGFAAEWQAVPIPDADALFGTVSRARRATDALALPEVCTDCGEFGPCGRHADPQF